ncbi:MAG: Na/Pi cotransporter family protein [Bacteroidia bacterium]|nr:Na/Pi cotransporter family protein [Bacteroidia bacterium]MBP7260202.1 Na/Pi cotransporter family protein [Bacteroidia bacterium]MBP9179833.1 Na/Pi cotransporter family protein [Bacteroidia bacterium]MBP9723832.1 Na/Pi cotransporter family protein [Bacteroidia bacterium]
MTEIILSIIAGLVLFLFAVSSLSDTLQSILGAKATSLIQRFTSNVFSSLVVGTIATTLLDSSSAVIIITIVLVNSKVLSFRQAMGIVLGANIGTTVSSQIIAMDIGKYSPVFLLVGFVLLFAAKSERISNIGKVILYFGVLFFGLFTMENAVEPLKNEAFFSEWMKKTENPFWGASIGALVTLLIQSSSATVGMAIILSKKGILSLTGGVAIMLGAELGTCSDTLLATIKGSREALKTGLFHVIFNLLSIVLGLLLFYPFLELVKTVSTGATIERTVANAHMLFNVLGVVVFIWTVPSFEKWLNKILPDKTE